MVRMLLAAGTTIGVLTLGFWLGTPSPGVPSRETQAGLCACGLPSEVLDLCVTTPAAVESTLVEIVEVLDIAQSAYAEPERLTRSVLESRPEQSNVIEVGFAPEAGTEAIPFPESTRVGSSDAELLRDRLTRGYIRWMSGAFALPGSTLPTE